MSFCISSKPLPHPQDAADLWVAPWVAKFYQPVIFLSFMAVDSSMEKWNKQAKNPQTNCQPVIFLSFMAKFALEPINHVAKIFAAKMFTEKHWSRNKSHINSRSSNLLAEAGTENCCLQVVLNRITRLHMGLAKQPKMLSGRFTMVKYALPRISFTDSKQIPKNAWSCASGAFLLIPPKISVCSSCILES